MGDRHGDAAPATWPAKRVRRRLRGSAQLVSITGTAELAHEGAEEHIHMLSRKYTGEDYPLKPDEERVIVKITPERVNPRS